MSTTLRRRASTLLNMGLNRLGYALVKFDGERSTTRFSTHEGTRYAYEDVHITDTLAPWALDEAFLDVWEKARHNTLTDIFRAWELYQLVRESAGAQGDMLEVGVWRGGTGAVIAAAANRWRPASTIWLCDTFEGVVKTGRYDTAYFGGEHADASKEDILALSSRLELANVAVLKGMFPEDTAAAIGERRIAFCHVDVDAYQSALEVVSWVAPRMDAGGVMVFDDYGFSTCKGVTRCVDELRGNGEWLYVHNLNKHAVLIKR